MKICTAVEPIKSTLGEDFISFKRISRSFEIDIFSSLEKKMFSGLNTVNPVYLEYRGETSDGKPENLDIISFLLEDTQVGSVFFLDRISCRLFSESEESVIIIYHSCLQIAMQCNMKME
ncbi:hypothetical protein YTPLAS21_11240 [Candidatus Nitrosocosmicus sp.]|nr:hypothetical protein YTPLAS21_11240 [Candidatus Nitrosocosmicus sp.]